MQNVGTADKAARAFLSALMFTVAWKRQGKLGVMAAYNAGILISSVFSGYCPLYELANINTAVKPEKAATTA